MAEPSSQNDSRRNRARELRLEVVKKVFIRQLLDPRPSSYRALTVGEILECLRDSRPTLQVRGEHGQMLREKWGPDATEERREPSSTAEQIAAILDRRKYDVHNNDDDSLTERYIAHGDKIVERRMTSSFCSHLSIRVQGTMMPMPSIIEVLEHILPLGFTMHDINWLMPQAFLFAGFAGPSLPPTDKMHVYLGHTLSHLSCQFHLRAISGRKRGQKAVVLNPVPSTIDGFICSRQQGRLPSLDRDAEIYLIEQRFSAYAAVDGFDSRIATLVNETSDGFEGATLRSVFRQATDDAQNHVDDRIRKGDYRDRDRFRATIVITSAFLSMIEFWEAEWRTMFRAIDDVLKIELDDILNDKDALRGLMFDSSFKRSEVYFVVLQLLRISAEWIREASVPPDYTEYVGGAVERHLQESAANLLAQINSKTEEVRSLRDGLFNASALQETSRATQINEYLFVFTVMTILYLPLSFVATLYGMDLFDFEDPSQKTSFATTTAVLSLVTYVVAVGMVWYVRQKHKVRAPQRRGRDEVERGPGKEQEDHGNRFGDLGRVLRRRTRAGKKVDGSKA